VHPNLTKPHPTATRRTHHTLFTARSQVLQAQCKAAPPTPPQSRSTWLFRVSENRIVCYDDEARPPLPPISGAAADQGDLVLTSSDGTKFGAYFARASKPNGAGMVVLPDVRGLHHFYMELAQRFAETGIDA